MNIRTHTVRRSLLAITIGLFATIGTAAAEGTKDPKAKDTGAYGGATYGGSTYGGATKAPPPAPAPAPQTYTEPAPMTNYVAETPVERPWYETWGLALAIGGGVEGFTHNGDTGTQTGGNWDVRASLGTKQIVAVEGSYIGSAQSIDAIGLDNSAVLVGNGLQGALRLNAITGYGIDFFGFGGAAWRHYDLTNETFNTSDVKQHDDVLEIPVGAGLQYAYEGMLLDARGEYRFAEYGSLFQGESNSGRNSTMDRWGASANIGYQF